ncbi:hypothetical protein EH31_02845 [Erythrobacter longus]|uniref:Toxin n=1 Tax=Erythrobacter longus TaxID=1044 RepID=A0A074MDV7_ERYLO|nr:type II toxin-antitoxin system RelE/ParE family toxin [Erythrobacter longus]KEO91624.1 hypothetical protein EH31_02845 [Erythrobacter longus]
MLEIEYLPRALSKIAEISDQTIADWGEAQAKRYIAGFRETIELAAEFPGMGARVYGLPAQYRKVPSGVRFIIYRANDDVLTVVRIIHEREDVPEGLDDI